MNETIAVGWLGPTNSYWAWILGHFRDVSLLSDCNLEDWRGSQSQSTSDKKCQSVLLVAVESRYSKTMDWLRKQSQEDVPEQRVTSKVPFCGLLGDDWVGHRRTFPLSESLQSFYWYELHDRVLPWLISFSQSPQAVSMSTTMNSGGLRRTSPRVQRWIDTSLAIERRSNSRSNISRSCQLALIVTETATTRELWCDAFTRQNVQCLATTPCNLKIWATPDVIVVDLESEPLALRSVSGSKDPGEPAETLIRQLVVQFPQAIILVAVSFPRWVEWESLCKCGADLIVAKPFQLTGIFDTLANVVFR